MADTITGAQFNEFYDHGWPQGYYHEPGEIQVEDEMGKRLITPEMILDLDKLGELYNDKGSGMNFRDAWQEWAGLQVRDEILVLKVPSERLPEVLRVLEDLGLAPVGHDNAPLLAPQS